MEHQILLNRHRSSIVADLHVEFIVDDLLSNNVISPDDYERMNKKGDTTKEKAGILLDCIYNRDRDAYSKFVDCLKKDYSWLHEKLIINDSNITMDIIRENVDDCLSRGEVPKKTLHYVSRTSLEASLCEKLVNLKRHNVLLVHGMHGCGKTSLVIGTLRNNPKLITNSLKNSVFWLNVSDCSTDEKIVQLQTRILRRVSSSENLMNSSASFMSMSSLSGSIYEPSWNDYRDDLKKAFQKDHLKDSLLIIDDLKDKKVIDAFDVGCKILITAQDSKLVGDSDVLKFDAFSPLTENESMEIISKFVEMDVSKLPSHAKDMHNMCKGNPLMMSLLGGVLASNKDKLRHDAKHWKNIKNQLKNKHSFIDRFNFGKSSNEKLTIEMCINSLNESNYIQMYKSLVILKENSKISTQALSIFLNLDIEKVETFMKLLKTKSLIIEYYNEEQKEYLYEIHDLIVSYLKNTYKESENEVKLLHVNLLKRYIKNDKHNLVNLPNDGYIANHIGYHIYETKNIENMWDLFTSLYTNLEFIGNRIRLAGVSCVKNDFDDYLYKSAIMDNPRYKELISKLDVFMHDHGTDLHRYPSTDIIQSILQHEHEGILQEEALKYTKHGHNRNNLYFNFQHDHGTELEYSTLPMNEELNIARLWLNYIFVGNQSGNITLWSIDKYKSMLTFYGHKSPVLHLSVNHKRPYHLASTCARGVLKIWKIDHIYRDYGEDSESSDSDNNDDFPKCDVHHSANSITHPSGNLCNITWARKYDFLLTHTNPGSTVLFYTSSGKMLAEIPIEESDITCSILSQDDSLAIVGHNSKNKFKLYMYCTKKYEVLWTLSEQEPIKSFALVPNDRKSFLVLTNTYIKVHKWKRTLLENSTQAQENISHFSVNNTDLGLAMSSKFQVVSVSRDSFVFVSTDDTIIHIYDIGKRAKLGEFNNFRGTVSIMDISLDEKDMFTPYLLTGSGGEEHSLKLWPIDHTRFSSKIVRKTIFDCVFNTPYNSLLNVNHSRGKSDPSTKNPLVRKEKQKYRLRKTLSLDKQSVISLKLPSVKEDFPRPLIAIADSSNSVQVIKGRNLVAKTGEAPCEITCVALSPCGSYLAYGLKNGDIILFSLKTVNGDRVMQTGEAIGYLEFLDCDKLVAAGKQNCLMMYIISQSVSKMLISGNYLGSQELLDSFTGMRMRRSPESNGTYSTGSPSSEDDFHLDIHRSSEKLLRKPCSTATVKCFMMTNSEMIVVGYDGSLKLWNFEPELLAVLLVAQEISVSCVCLHQNYLVICGYNGTYQVLHLQQNDNNKHLEAECITKHTNKERILCCAISHNLLAMGCNSGNIFIWHIVDKVLVKKIKFHKLPVHGLEFSPMPSNMTTILDSPEYIPLVLVSLAGQVVWWDISSILNKRRQSLKQIGRKKDPAILSPSPSINNNQVSHFNFTINQWENKWIGKRYRTNCDQKDLLACIKLTGDKGLKIKTDSHFSTFVTVDQGGVLSVMNILNNSAQENGPSNSSFLI